MPRAKNTPIILYGSSLQISLTYFLHSTTRFIALAIRMLVFAVRSQMKKFGITESGGVPFLLLLLRPLLIS
jgi:hypothetical protein